MPKKSANTGPWDVPPQVKEERPYGAWVLMEVPAEGSIEGG